MMELGLTLETLAPEALMDRALELARSFAGAPTVALGLAKRQVEAAATNSFDQQIELESLMQPIASRTEDHEEGLKAFRERRKPAFKGA
jgi:2-(1,2-epoxy-1,2-dihydrophenyl)acetyl-CoA isomerase